MGQTQTDAQPLNELQASQRLQTLYVVNDMLKQVEADGLDINAILPRVLNVAVKQLHAVEGTIIVVNRDLEIEHAWLTDKKSDAYLGEIMSGGLAGWVIRNKKPGIIDDTRSDHRWLPRPGHPTTSEPWSVICYPFIIRNRAIGAITIHKEGERQFDERDLNLLSTIANQAASTIENARLYEKSQRQLQITALLNEASQVINSSLDLDEIMQSLLAQMNELMHAQAISIALVDTATNELVYRVAEGLGSAEIVGLRLPSNHGLSGWVMEHGEPALVNDTSSDSRFQTLGDQRTGYLTRAMICAPIQFKGEVLGTIQAINPIHGRFTQEDLNLLVNLANIASSALAHAQQFARTQAAEARYLSLFEDSVDPIILTDLQGNVVETNRRASEFLGYDGQDLRQMVIADIHRHPDKLPKADAITADEVTVLRDQAVTKEGELIHVEVYVKRTLSGDAELLQWIHHDISQQVELEEMREDMTAMLFHDLQSPLGNIITSLELLQFELPPESDPTLLSMLDIARRSSQRLQTLIRSLLDINQLEAGHSILDRTSIDVYQLVDEVNEIEQPNMEKRTVKLVRDLAPNLPLVHIDEDMIRRVLINLVDNALKYSMNSQDVTVSAQNLPKDAMVLISVSDQGIGIPQQYRKSIFQKFERIQTDGESKGLGLGLAFCRLAVEAHGGQIWVDDAPGGGARFNFTLPVVPESQLVTPN